MRLYPVQYKKNVSKINLPKLWNAGKRGIICDIDNTLCRDEQFEIENNSIKFIEDAKKTGFKICLMSNNGEKRVKPVADALGCPYHFKAHKPKPEAYLTCLEKIGVSKEQAVMVGDQLFTDIWGANNLGIYSIMVEKIHKKEIWQIKLKRPFEKIIMLFYKKEN